MIYTLVVFVGLISMAFLIHYLRSIQKHASTVLQFNQFKQELMGYLLEMDPNLKKQDYLIVKQMLDWNDTLCQFHSTRRSSLIHLRVYIDLLKFQVWKSYEIDKRSSQMYSDNLTILRFQKKLSDILSWSVVYNIPIYLVFAVKFSIITQFHTILMKASIISKREEVNDWFTNKVNEQLKKESFFGRALSV